MALPQGLCQLCSKVFQSGVITLEELLEASVEKSLGEPMAFGSNSTEEIIEVLNCIFNVICFPKACALVGLMFDMCLDEAIK